MTCRSLEVVVVPHPLSDRQAERRRPALVVSRRSFNRNGFTVLAMITTGGGKLLPGDIRIDDLNAAGLSKACLVRPKLFTVDNRLILRSLGRLAGEDARAVQELLAGALV